PWTIQDRTAGRIPALPLAWLGVRDRHRPVLVRPEEPEDPAIPGRGRAGRRAGQGSLRRRDLSGDGRARVRGRRALRQRARSRVRPSYEFDLRINAYDKCRSRSRYADVIGIPDILVIACTLGASEPNPYMRQPKGPTDRSMRRPVGCSRMFAA